MTRRIAFIESNSGYVWGDTIDGWCSDTTADVELIAEQMDRHINMGCSSGYDSHPSGIGCPDYGYYVAYEIPGDLDVANGDGQAQEYIDAVCAGKKLGYVWRVRNDDE